MASKKPTDVNKARLAALKKLGILKSVPLNRPLSDKDKSAIRKEFKKYHVVANAAKGEFKTQNIKSMSARDRKRLKETGYLIHGDKVFLPTQGYDTASVKTVWTRNPETGYQEKTLEVVRYKTKMPDGTWRTKERDFIGTPLEKMAMRDRLLSEYRSGKFKEGEYIALKVFDNGKFEREIFMSIDKALQYASQIQWHDKDKQKMEDNLHIVKISVTDYRDIASSDMGSKQREHNKYIRKKNNKKTSTLRVTNPEKLKEISNRKASRKAAAKTKITGRKKK